MATVSLAQQYVDMLLGNIGLEAFGFAAGGLRFVCADDVRPPVALQEAWHQWAPHAPAELLEWATTERTAGVSCIVVIADLMQHNGVEALEGLCAHLWDIVTYDPAMLILPVLHPQYPHVHQESAWNAEQVAERASALCADATFDEVIWHPADGFSLAFAVQAKVKTLTGRSLDYEDQLRKRILNFRKQHRLALEAPHCCWDFLCPRIFPAIPPQRPGVLDTGLGQWPFLLDTGFMRTPIGTVFSAVEALRHAAVEAPPPASSVLIVDKTRVCRLSSLRMVNSYMEALLALTVLPHPNLPYLVDAFQTPQRLYIQMHCLGDCTLFSRLRQRDEASCHGQAARLPLSVGALTSVIEQTTAAVVHLHLALALAHRDLKPENMVVREHGPACMHVRVCGFELTTSEQRSRLPCGTADFAAPEVILAGASSYDCKSADIWSLGVLFAELLCGVKSFSRYLPEQAMPVRQGRGPFGEMCPEPSSRTTALWLQELFRDPQTVPMIFTRAAPEGAAMTGWVMPLVRHMLVVNPAQRLTAHALQSSLGATFQHLQK